MIATRLIVSALVAFVADVIPSLPRRRRRRSQQGARRQNRLGWDYMQSEQFENAVKAFQSVDRDRSERSRCRSTDSAARTSRSSSSSRRAARLIALPRRLISQQVGRQFTSQQEAQRYRQDRVTEIDEMIRQVQSGPQTLARQDQLRQVQEQRRQIQEYITRGNSVTIENAVPAWVSLSLGSALFPLGKLRMPKREYKAAISADRLDRAKRTATSAVGVSRNGSFQRRAATRINAAKKSGFKVNPELEKSDSRASKVDHELAPSTGGTCSLSNSVPL